MLKSSYRSSSTNSLYDFAEELTSFNKTNSKQEKNSSTQSNNTNSTNAYAHNHDSETHDIDD